MPRKKNNRKAIQKAKRAAQPKPNTRHIGAIAHFGAGGHGLAMAIMASGIMRAQERRPLDDLRAALKEDGGIDMDRAIATTPSRAKRYAKALKESTK